MPGAKKKFHRANWRKTRMAEGVKAKPKEATKKRAERRRKRSALREKKFRAKPKAARAKVQMAAATAPGTVILHRSNDEVFPKVADIDFLDSDEEELVVELHTRDEPQISFSDPCEESDLDEELEELSECEELNPFASDTVDQDDGI